MALNMPVGRPDILSSDGKHVFMKSQPFDLEGNRGPLGPHSSNPLAQASVQAGEEAHLFSPTGFLDGSCWHRTYWVYGRSFAGGWRGWSLAGRYAPAGRIMVVDDKNAYVFKHSREHQLWSADKMPPPKPAVEPDASWIGVANAPELDPTEKPLAVEAWVNTESWGGVIVAHGGSAQGYALLLKEGRPVFTVRSEYKLTAVTSESDPEETRPLGRWMHLAGVLTGKKLHIYVDGELSGTADAQGLIAGRPAQPMAIGADGRGAVGDYLTAYSPYKFKGLIDEVRVYFGEVRPGEIARHAASVENVDVENARLVVRYSFDKGDAADDTGGENPGVLPGIPGLVEPAAGRFGGAMKFAGRAAENRINRIKFHWAEDIPFFVRAMAVADKTLFIAGPPDLVDEAAVRKRLSEEDVQQQLVKQANSLNGKEGALLWAVSTADGKKTAAYQLAEMPAWDSMAAANGRLYWTTVEGKVVCWKGRR
jgi:hypothetical protein